MFVAHCLLDQNARYVGGAFHSGAVPELIESLQRGVAIAAASTETSSSAYA